MTMTRDSLTKVVQTAEDLFILSKDFIAIIPLVVFVICLVGSSTEEFGSHWA